MRVKRGDIFLADLDEQYGSEQGGIRPVLIIQNNKGNKYSPTTIAACITSRVFSKAHLPTHYYVPSSVGLRKNSMIMLEQIRVIDKKRLIKKIGFLTKRQMIPINERILLSLDCYRNTIKDVNKIL